MQDVAGDQAISAGGTITEDKLKIPSNILLLLMLGHTADGDQGFGFYLNQNSKQLGDIFNVVNNG